MIEDSINHSKIIFKIGQTVGLDPMVTIIVKMRAIPIKINCGGQRLAITVKDWAIKLKTALNLRKSARVEVSNLFALEVLLFAIIARKKGIRKKLVETKREKDQQVPLIEIMISVGVIEAQ